MEGAPTDTLTGVTRQWANAAARSGDADAFAELYEHIAPSVFTWATLRIRPHERTVVEPGDLVVVATSVSREWSKFVELDRVGL